jgi:hypothetical protein
VADPTLVELTVVDPTLVELTMLELTVLELAQRCATGLMAWLGFATPSSHQNSSGGSGGGTKP